MISCNVIAWSFLGLSMTNWNTILSLVETLIFLYLAYLIKDLHHEKIKNHNTLIVMLSLNYSRED